MRLRLMATYLGVPYQAGLGPDGTEVTLFSPGPPPEDLGFTAAAGHWRKQVDAADLGALWQSRPVGDYRGEPCLVLDDLGDRLHIAYLGRDSARAAQLGYWEIDREVFEVVVARHDVTGLTEERVEFPLTAAMFPPSGAGPQAPDATAATAAAAGVAAGPERTGPQPLAGAEGARRQPLAGAEGARRQPLAGAEGARRQPLAGAGGGEAAAAGRGRGRRIGADRRGGQRPRAAARLWPSAAGSWPSGAGLRPSGSLRFADAGPGGGLARVTGRRALDRPGAGARGGVRVRVRGRSGAA